MRKNRKQFYFEKETKSRNQIGSTARSTIASDARWGLNHTRELFLQIKTIEKKACSRIFFFFGSRKVSDWSTVNQVSAIALAFVVKFR
jgi:hypothetical protein